MPTYNFPRVSGGCRWNMLRRIKERIGIEPTVTCDLQIDGEFITQIIFNQSLNRNQEQALNVVMADNPTQPPASTGTIFKIDDISTKLDQYSQNTGIDWKLYFTESIPGSGVLDTIELHAGTVLTSQQKLNAKNAFLNLIRQVQN